MARKGNFDFLSNFDRFVPNGAQVFLLLFWLLVGALFGSIVLFLIQSLTMGSGAWTQELSTLITYPLMFIPPMIYASSRSRMNMNERGVKLDSSHFSPTGGLLCALLAAAGTLAMNFSSDALGSLLPEMPEMLKNALDSMTQGTLWVDLICVSVFAPLFEEWLCRGMVLRGLLHRMKPAWAIVLSALFFAFIHLNPWQAIPAFLLGCLFGYVYYRTGSLKLTMLMHCVNNTAAVLLSHISGLDKIVSWKEVLPAPLYWVLTVAGLVIAILVVLAFRRIPLQSEKGNCDVIPSIFEQ